MVFYQTVNYCVICKDYRKTRRDLPMVILLLSGFILLVRRAPIEGTFAFAWLHEGSVNTNYIVCT